jgi:hypothetical protein
MTRKRKSPKKKKPTLKRYKCDRCGTPTRSVFEGENVQADYNAQLDGGLTITASGYYGGFWDTLAFMGEEPVTFHLCHDCSLWLTRQIPKMKEAAKGGHFSSNVQGEGTLHAYEARKGTDEEHCKEEKAMGIKVIEICCEHGVPDHEQGSDPTGAYDNPKERVGLEKGSGL